MIIGIGTDIVDMRRIEAALDRFGNRFRTRIYSSRELQLAGHMKDTVGFLAKRWAAKEACSKALGTGMRSGVAWRNIETCSNERRMPVLSLTGGAALRLSELIPPGHQPSLHVTLSDDRPFATATVIIEAIPVPDTSPGR